jgi:hypothetical protein
MLSSQWSVIFPAQSPLTLKGKARILRTYGEQVRLHSRGQGKNSSSHPNSESTVPHCLPHMPTLGLGNAGWVRRYSLAFKLLAITTHVRFTRRCAHMQNLRSYCVFQSRCTGLERLNWARPGGRIHQTNETKASILITWPTNPKALRLTTCPTLTSLCLGGSRIT